MTRPTVVPVGQVLADAIYTLDYIRDNLGLGAAAMREARKSGLRVRYVGRRGFVLGSDLIAFVRDVARDEK